MKIKMNRDYKPSYKFGWMYKGQIYNIEETPITSAKAEGLVKSGYASKVAGFTKTTKLKKSVRNQELEDIVKLNEEEKQEKKAKRDERKAITEMRKTAKARKASKKEA